MCKARGSDGYRCFVINKCRSITGKTKSGVAYSSANTKAVQEAPADMEVDDDDCSVVEVAPPPAPQKASQAPQKEKEVILLDSDDSDDDAPLFQVARKL